MRRHDQAGFTLIEVLISTAIFVLISFALFEAMRHLATSTQRVSTAQHGRSDLASLVSQLETDQQSAEAIFIPATDVFGNSNATPHEIDFYAKDGESRPYYWAYDYDATAHTLQRYDYASPGSTAQKAGAPLMHITSLRASVHAISEITTPSSPIYLPLLTGATNYDVPLSAGPGITGGTHVVDVVIASDTGSVQPDLAAAAAPSGFTVVLNYTPRPNAAPTPDLKTWPIAVKYGANNTDVAAGCHAIAYKDTALTQPDTNNQTFTGLGVTTDNNGCYNGALVAYEPPGIVATFSPQSSACALAVRFGLWSPANQGNVASITIGTGSPIASCSLVITDGGIVSPTFGHGLILASVGGPPHAVVHTIYATQPGNCNVAQDPNCFNTIHEYWWTYQFEDSRWSLVGYQCTSDAPSNPSITNGEALISAEFDGEWNSNSGVTSWTPAPPATIDGFETKPVPCG